MTWINKQKFFNRYLPMFLSVVLIVAAAFAYLIFRPQTPVAEAAPAYIQQATCRSGGASCTISITPTAGDALLVFISEDNPTTFTVSDNKSNQYSVANSFYGPNAGLDGQESFLANNVAGGATTITCSDSDVLTDLSCTAIELGGGYLTVDKTAVGNSSSATTNLTTAASATTTSASEVVVACASNYFFSFSSFSASPPWTVTSASGSTGGASGADGLMGCEYQNVSSTGTFSGNLTAGTAQHYVMQLVTLKGKTGNLVQQGGKFRQVGGRVLIGGAPYYIPQFVSATSTDTFNNSPGGVSTASYGVSAGNLLVVSCTGSINTSTISAPTDTAGNTFTANANSYDSSAFHVGVFIFYSLVTNASPTDVITCNSNATNEIEIVVTQFSGISSSPVDASPSPGSVSGGPVTATTGAFSTLQSTELGVMCGMVSGGGQSFAITSGYTMPANGTDPGGYAACGYQVFSTTQSSVTASITMSPGNGGQIAITGNTYKALHR